MCTYSKIISFCVVSDPQGISQFGYIGEGVPEVGIWIEGKRKEGKKGREDKENLTIGF
jgi:hypothetical protein